MYARKTRYFIPLKHKLKSKRSTRGLLPISTKQPAIAE